jgi:nitrogen fixation-related uncharacterized protein
MITILVPTFITLFFVGAAACFCIKQKCYEDDLQQKTSSYKPLLDDSFSERVV